MKGENGDVRVAMVDELQNLHGSISRTTGVDEASDSRRVSSCSSQREIESMRTTRRDLPPRSVSRAQVTEVAHLLPVALPPSALYYSYAAQYVLPAGRHPRAPLLHSRPLPLARLLSPSLVLSSRLTCSPSYCSHSLPAPGSACRQAQAGSGRMLVLSNPSTKSLCQLWSR